MALDYAQGFPLIILDRGPLFYLHIVCTYSYYLVGLCLLFRMYVKSNREKRHPIILMIIGSLSVFGFPFVHAIGAIKAPIDISPFGLIISGLFYLWGIYQFNMLKFSPLAMKKVFESIHDAVIIFDSDNTLKSYNNAANMLFEPLPDKKIIGSCASQVLSHIPPLLQLVEYKSVTDSVTAHSMQLRERHYHVQLSLIYGRNNKPVGKMLLLHDITESIQYEKSLLQQANQLSELNLFKDKMFKVVAHDIRDPLASLSIFSS